MCSLLRSVHPNVPTMRRYNAKTRDNKVQIEIKWENGVHMAAAHERTSLMNPGKTGARVMRDNTAFCNMENKGEIISEREHG